MSSYGAEAGGFVRTRDDLEAPDLQTGLTPARCPTGARAGPARGRRARRATAQEPGERHVALRRPADPPAIDPGYLADPADLEVLVAGARLARAIAAREPLAGLVDAERSPGAGVGDGDALWDWIRADLASMLSTPSGHVRDGRPGRRGLRARTLRPARRRRAAGRRRVRHARRPAGQRQRADDRARGARGRRHPRQHAALGKRTGWRSSTPSRQRR